MQVFDPKLVVTVDTHSKMVKGPAIGTNFGSKDCVNLPFPIVISRLNTVAQAIYDKKGMNTLALDVRQISSLTDYVIIAEGNIDKHVIAIAHAIIEQLKTIGQVPSYIAGIQEGDWVVVDYLNIIIHLFKPGFRDRYALEQFLRRGEIVDLKIDLRSPQKIT